MSNKYLSSTSSVPGTVLGSEDVKGEYKQVQSRLHMLMGLAIYLRRGGGGHM